MKTFEQLKELIAKSQGDVDKANNGNKAACVRLRASIQEIKDVCNDVRAEALSIKKK